MQYFPFSKRPDLLVFTCTHVLEDEMPITFVSHHYDDNNWQFLCHNQHEDIHAVIISITELCAIDPSIEELCDLPVGHYAQRKNRNAKWQIGRLPDEEAYPDNHHH